VLACRDKRYRQRHGAGENPGLVAEPRRVAAFLAARPWIQVLAGKCL